MDSSEGGQHHCIKPTCIYNVAQNTDKTCSRIIYALNESSTSVHHAHTCVGVDSIMAPVKVLSSNHKKGKIYHTMYNVSGIIITILLMH